MIIYEETNKLVSGAFLKCFSIIEKIKRFTCDRPPRENKRSDANIKSIMSRLHFLETRQNHVRVSCPYISRSKYYVGTKAIGVVNKALL